MPLITIIYYEKKIEYQNSASLIAHRGNKELRIKNFENSILYFYSLETCYNQKQPFENEKSLNVIDGEIYNIKELSIRFNIPEKIRNDANQVINYLYEVKGENFVNFLNGMFTIVLIEFKKNKLFVFKDKLSQFYLLFQSKTLFHQVKSIVNCNNDTKINYQNSLASIFCAEGHRIQIHILIIFMI